MQDQPFSLRTLIIPFAANRARAAHFAIAVGALIVLVSVSGCKPSGEIGLTTLVSSSATQDESKPGPVPKDTLPKEFDLESIPVGLEFRPEIPEDNPMTPEKVQLGRRLFFDPILSRDGTVACASCHQPDHHFASPDAVAIGVDGRTGKRNAPSLMNSGYGTSMFWDGRAATLEEQALQPLTNPDELGSDIDKLIDRLRSEESYVAEFSQVFSESGEPDVELVTPDNLVRAIATFERALLLGNSQVDRFRNSNHSALSRDARQGLWIFESKGGCWQCHSGRNLTDESFHNTGVSFGIADRDTGRMEHTEAEEDCFKFKTPTLRGVEHSAPYMHDGSLATLREVVEFYNRGGSPDDELLDPKLKPLNLTEEEIGFLVAYLQAQSN